MRGASAAGALLVLVCAALVGAGSPQAPLLTLGLYALLFGPYVWLARALGRHQVSLWGVLLLALLVRALFIWPEPIFSDDIYRYVWDGRVGAAGINPYLYAPDAAQLAHLRDAVIWPAINHKPISTIYPPLSQLLFELNAHLGAGLAGLRGLFIALEALMLWGAARLLGASWREARWRGALALYLFNPLVLVEGIWSGHVDILAWGTLTLALVCFRQRRSRRGALGAGVFLGLSVAAKMLAVIVLPLLLFAPRAPRVTWREAAVRRALLGVAAGLVVGLSYAPYVSVGGKMFEGFGEYATRWRGNDGPFRALTTLSAVSLQRAAPQAWREHPEDPGSRVFVTLSKLEPLYFKLGKTRQWEGRTIAANTYDEQQLAQSVAKLIVAGLMGLMLLWCVLVVRAPLRGALLLLGTLFFLAPTLYPWYVAWLVPLAALTRQRTPLLFGALSLVAYFAWVSHALGGEWEVPTWAVTLEFGAVFAVGFWEVTRPRRPRNDVSA